MRNLLGWRPSTIGSGKRGRAQLLLEALEYRWCPNNVTFTWNGVPGTNNAWEAGGSWLGGTPTDSYPGEDGSTTDTAFSGTINLTTGGSLTLGTGAAQGTIQNNGTITKSSSYTYTLYDPIQNAAQLNILSGRLSLINAIPKSGGDRVKQSNGTTVINPGATLDVGTGNVDVVSGYLNANGGSSACTINGNLILNGSPATTILTLGNGGSNGAVGQLVVSNTFTWTSGTVQLFIDGDVQAQSAVSTLVANGTASPTINIVNNSLPLTINFFDNSNGGHGPNSSWIFETPNTPNNQAGIGPNQPNPSGGNYKWSTVLGSFNGGWDNQLSLLWVGGENPEAAPALAPAAPTLVYATATPTLAPSLASERPSVALLLADRFATLSQRLWWQHEAHALAMALHGTLSHHAREELFALAFQEVR